MDHFVIIEPSDSSSDFVEPEPTDPWDCDPVLLAVRPKLFVFLDLDLTLIATGGMAQGHPDFAIECQGRQLPVCLRPGLARFLDRLSLFANWYIYTAAQEDYANQVLNVIDPQRRISRLFTRKDCERIRPLVFRKRWEDTGIAFFDGVTFIVDDIPSNFGGYAAHGVRIAPYRCDPQDQELRRVLKEIYVRSGGR